jgi:hypothetical protein
MNFKRMLQNLLVLAALIPMGVQAQADNPATVEPHEEGVLLNRDGTFDGYTLFAPLIGNIAYLIDMEGQVVKTWTLEGTTSQVPYLLENGNLVYQTGANSAMLPEFGQVGGVAGGIKEYDWDGELLWSFDYAGDTYIQHHDIEPLPNGNILLIAWEALPETEALAMGMNPDRLPDGETLWPDQIAEVNPATNEIVWEWHVWDHLVQDYDPDLPNYGVVSQHPERIDLNYVGQRTLGDWQHTNAIDYNPELDQVLLSVRNFSEIWIIDHSTTTEEAAGSSGGQSGMGGDLLYRWGNPATYQAGTAEDQQLFYQHDAQWIEPGNPGAGNILIFNNGDETTHRTYSTVLEITPPLSAAGTYEREVSAYAPPELVWEYRADPPESLFAPFVSSVQRLPNGNTFIVDGTGGRFLEVTSDGEVVWEYLNEFTGSMPTQGYFGPTSVFRAQRYAPDYPGLARLARSLQSDNP